MSIFRSNTVGSWTRGGQAIVHNMRMTTQVLFQTGLTALGVFVLGTVWYTLDHTNAYDRYVVVKAIEAGVKESNTFDGDNDKVHFKTPSGRIYWTSASGLTRSKLLHNTGHRIELALISGMGLAGGGSLLALLWTWYYFHRTGAGLGSNEFIRGAKLGTAHSLRLRLFWKAKGSFAIAGVPVPDAFEPEHFVLSGAPGTGKTNVINGMLHGMRTKGRRAIVYDTAGTFVEKFYRPGIDILLNPLDERSAPWSPWVDVPKEYHYDQIAESTIPDKQGDPFWPKAARGTLVAVLRKLALLEHTLVSVLLDTILRSKTADLAKFAQGTDAAAFISVEGEKTSAGIQAELASVLKSFAYLDDTTDGFSIRKWVTNETDDSWLFITTKADQLPSLRPLITTWLDIAISATMSMKPDRNRRLYVVVDELPSLQRLPSLSDFLARARKYGGCAILGFQSYPQLEATYGIQDAAALTGYCSTWVALRANDNPTAKHASENLGQVEQVEANEGLSYGVNDMRDGVNLSRIQVLRPIVLATEIQNLPNLQGYLRFGRNLPVVQFTDQWRDLSSHAEAFIERTSPPIRLPIAREILGHNEVVTVDGEIIDVKPTGKPKAANQRPRTTNKDEVRLPEAPLLDPYEQDGPTRKTDEKSASDQAGNETPPAKQRTTAAPRPVAFTSLFSQQPRVELKSHDRNNAPSQPARPA